VISYGNACDLDAAEFLEYLAGDEETEIITCYIEGVKDGRRFFEAVKECMKRKPVVILKAGVTEGGAAAAASHTAALAGSESVWHAFFKQTGAISVQSLEEIVDVVLALLHFPCLGGSRVGIVGRGGGIGVIATDSCEKVGLAVPSFTEETRNQLEKVNPEAGASVRNPVETALGLGGASQFYQEGLKIVDADPQIDFILTHVGVDVYGGFGPSLAEQLGQTMDILIETVKTMTKPVVVVLYPGARLDVISAVAQAQQRCLEARLPVYSTIEAAAKAVSKLIRYHEFIKGSSS
jgi:acyl-CoA synthetase (NDP forming)